ncbi:peptidoglycan-binding protein [Streptomyces sp. NPDC056944]|uniref:peptidoglycan-binding protein n=1 Tax=Streptomyces sp. NPDC056944 TaxID=3345972 RepID=UPI0036309050
MSVRWITGAERLGDGSIGGAMDLPKAGARVVWHTTESGDGDQAFKNVANYLIEKGNEPHVLYDPRTDRLGQFGPLDQSARALQNDGSTRTNRVGKVCIQIEVLARAKSPFTKTWRPGPNFRALMAAIRSWGVPDTFPMGAPPAYPGGSRRDRAVWLVEAGHYCHANAPGNNHGDPGAIDPKALFAAAPVEKPKPPAPKTPPFPGAQYFRAGANNAYVTRLGQALVRKGFGRFYSVGPGPRWGEADRKATQAFQRAQGWTGSDADGYPGPSTWSRLMK